jgi:hypothetical protein
LLLHLFLPHIRLVCQRKIPSSLRQRALSDVMRCHGSWESAMAVWNNREGSCSYIFSISHKNSKKHSGFPRCNLSRVQWIMWARAESSEQTLRRVRHLDFISRPIEEKILAVQPRDLTPTQVVLSTRRRTLCLTKINKYKGRKEVPESIKIPRRFLGLL